MTVYRDIDGHPHRRPANAPVGWRIGSYAVIEREGRLLLVQPVWTPGWTLPGGGVRLDVDESILEGITREVSEETGYRFDPQPDTLAFLGDECFRAPSGRFMRSVTFTVRGSVDGEPEAGWFAPEDEIVRIAWVDPATLGPGDVQWFHWRALARLGYVEGAGS